jgi:quercetin dioxygenase-like cupin family protein
VRGERTSPPDARPQVAISREGQALVIDGSMTGGAYAIVEIVSTPGDPPTPPHVHVDSEEAIYVASGEISITAADETYAAPAGTFALVPRGTVHSHSYRGEGPARVLLIGSPPSGIGPQPERAGLRVADRAPC